MNRLIGNQQYGFYKRMANLWLKTNQLNLFCLTEEISCEMVVAGAIYIRTGCPCHVFIHRDEDGRHTGQALVTFSNWVTAEFAALQLNGSKFLGRRVFMYQVLLPIPYYS